MPPLRDTSSAAKEPPTKSLGYSIYRPSKTPVLDTVNSLAYLLDGDGFYGVNYETQELLWKYRDGYIDSLRPVAPVTCDGKVYAYFSDKQMAYIVGFDGLTGSELWRHELDTVTFYPPIIANGYIFACTENRTIAVDLETHKMVWEYPDGGFLTVANNKLFLASHTGYVYVFGQLATSVDSGTEPDLPVEYKLHLNYPNPFNMSTTIDFYLPTRSHTEVGIYNVLGQRVRTLLSTVLPAGDHTVRWEGADDNGHDVSSGTYLYKLSTDENVITRKMILIK